MLPGLAERKSTPLSTAYRRHHSPAPLCPPTPATKHFPLAALLFWIVHWQSVQFLMAHHFLVLFSLPGMSFLPLHVGFPQLTIRKLYSFFKTVAPLNSPRLMLSSTSPPTLSYTLSLSLIYPLFLVSSLVHIFVFPYVIGLWIYPHVTHYHKLTNLKDYTFIISHFFRSEIWMGSSAFSA